MAPRPHQLPLLLLLLLLSAAIAAPSSSHSHLSFPVFDGKSTTDGVVVATNTSMLAPATFLFDAQLFPEFNESEGFVLHSWPVALWRAAGNGTRDEASLNCSFTLDLRGSGSDAVAFVVLFDSFPPFKSNDRNPQAMNGSALSAGAAAPSAANGLAAVELGTVSSYGPSSPAVGLNVTITPNRSCSAASQLAVRIAYDAAAHRLWVYVDDARLNSTSALLDAPLDLAGQLPTQDALVGFFSSTVRDVVVGVRDWELTVDGLPDNDADGPPLPPDDEQSTTLSSAWLAILLAVLGSTAAVSLAVISVMLYRVLSRRRALDREVQKCYMDYFARMHTDQVK